ncbi:MAG: DUF2232 domain-containing protein [Alphaproteobacteria bacterium]|jgi:hypothetical protein|nr:DUF2232 domain-containing protein [Alphaproteobacteria bacterium]
MGKTIAIAVLGGLASAVCTLSVVTGSGLAMVIAYLSALPLFLVGLSMGAAAGAIAGLAGAVIVLLGGGAIVALVYLGLTAIPAAWSVRVALTTRTADDGTTTWTPPGPILMGLIGWGLALYGVGIAAAIAQGQDPVATLERAMVETATALGGGTPETPVVDVFRRMAVLIPGMVLASWVLMTAINGALAQSLLRRAGRAIRPSAGLADLALPSWGPGAFALALVAAFLSTSVVGDVGTTVAVVLGFAYLLVGLGTVHALTRGRPLRGLMLTLVYGALLLLGWPAVILAGLGVIEQWVGLRRRAHAGTGPDRKE